MKKKTKLTPKENKTKSEYSSLNSQLGTFDLEPPKIYREESRKSNQQSSQPKKKNTPKTQQQKRVAQKKKRKRSKIFYKVASIIAMVLAIVAVIVTLSLTVFFKIDKIDIQGNEKYTRAEIMAVLPIEKGKNLFASNTEGAKNKLETNLPYIYNAEIKRKFPSTLVINITETPKIYSVKNEDKTYLLLDQKLKVLERNANKKPKKAVSIKNVTPTTAVTGKTANFKGKNTKNDLLKMIGIINKLKLDEITTISSVDVNTNYLVYDGRIKIKVGETDNLENKVYSALTAIEKLSESDPNATGTIIANNDKQIYFTEE